MNPQRQPSSPHSRQFGRPRSHCDGNPENVTPCSSVPWCHQCTAAPCAASQQPRWENPCGSYLCLAGPAGMEGETGASEP